MRSLICLVISAGLGTAANAQQAAPKDVGGACPVTMPASRVLARGGNYGNEFIAVGLWRNGKVVFEPGRSGHVLEDGSLAMKFPWWRHVDGQLVIEGHRLDAPSPQLHSEIPDGYGTSGFQSTALVFPTPGCWEVVGRVGQRQLTFVTEVVKIGAGAPWPRH